MNESSVSSAFQTKLRQALPGCVVIKHADKSMIGMVDASVTFNYQTIWMEYKCIKPATKGVVWREFMKTGAWSPLEVAAASPTQFEFAKTLARAGRCVYLFWVLDHEALRIRIKHVVLWHPIDGVQVVFPTTNDLVEAFVDYFQNGNNHLWLP
jgi:hypothetical protein